MEILAKLFGSTARVKIMRLFLLNPSQGFETHAISSRSKVTAKITRAELNSLLNMGFLKRKVFFVEEDEDKSKKKTKINGWCLNTSFPYIDPLKSLLIDPEFLKKEDLAERFKAVGKVKLLIVAGIFTRNEDSRVDLLIVGDNLKKTVINQIMKTLEAEIGKELSYATFDTPEFLYRYNMYDKLVRDILDYPHEKIIESPQLSLKANEPRRMTDKVVRVTAE
jgi:predicted nucleotidyltransferase